jgi:hypothetical protein
MHPRQFAIFFLMSIFSVFDHTSAFAQQQSLKLEALAAKGLQTHFSQTYEGGNGRQMTSAELQNWIKQNKVNVGKLPSDIQKALRANKLQAFLVPKVNTPRGQVDVITVRVSCSTGARGCSGRALLITTPGITYTSDGDDNWCEYCSGCDGLGPNCTYETCVCTLNPSKHCKTCPACKAGPNCGPGNKPGIPMPSGGPPTGPGPEPPVPPLPEPGTPGIKDSSRRP